MEIARHWRLREQRYRLIGEECENCEQKIFPPRDICPNCGQPASKKFEFSGKGKVEFSTTIYEAPTGYEKYAPYKIAHVRLDEGPLLTAQLTDLDGPNEPIEKGARVEMVTRKMRDDEDDERGIIVYGYKFRRPIEAFSPPTGVSTSSK
jgi:uncharacterized OB-fold protein